MPIFYIEPRCARCGFPIDPENAVLLSTGRTFHRYPCYELELGIEIPYELDNTKWEEKILRRKKKK